MLGVAPSEDGGFDPDGLQLRHEQAHALQAIAPLDALLVYWRLRGLDAVCTPQEAYAHSFAAAARGEMGRAWGLRPHERFAETFAVLTHPIPATEREWPPEWNVPLTEARRDALRAFYADMPRRAKPWYVPISDYYPPRPTIAVAAAPPDPTLAADIDAFWAGVDATPSAALTHAEFARWATNFERQYGMALRRLMGTT